MIWDGQTWAGIILVSSGVIVAVVALCTRRGRAAILRTMRVDE